MSEESDRAGAEGAPSNRGPRREPPIIDAQANEAPSTKPMRAKGTGLTLFALLVGVSALAAGGASLWMTLNLRDTSTMSEASAALAQRLDRLERRVGALENKPAPTIPDTAPLAARIGSLDTKADRIAAEAQRAAQMAEEALRKPAAQNAGDPMDLAPLDQRISALEQRPVPKNDDARLNKIESDMASVAKNTAPNLGPAMAVVVAHVQEKLQRGETFLREIAALEKLKADAKLISALKPLAQSAPSAQKLMQEFASLVTPMLRAAQPAPEGEDLMDRISRSAASLVRIRPIGETAQDNTPALISRMEAHVQRQEWDQALALFDKLPTAAQEPARAWAQSVKTRAQADQAVRQLIAQAIDMIAEK